MPIQVEIKLIPELANNQENIEAEALAAAGLHRDDIHSIKIVRKSLDARSRQIYFLLKVDIYLKRENELPKLKTFQYKPVTDEKTCHIIGFGPAGIYAALQCLELGIKPIILERGKPVEERIKDISAIHKKQFIDGDSNYCFGEGGAGTYSDGKLYTRSNKRGDIQKVLDVLIQHGANENIGYEAHPHIGTNKLPKLIESMRKTIIAHGGEIHFQTKLIDFEIADAKIQKIITENHGSWPVQRVILATGHSARDIFYLLRKRNILIEAKPFAIGVRIEHPQTIIDAIQYKRPNRGDYLPPSSYSIVTQACGKGVFSFCMCPGGVICPAATDSGEVVVNGWSSSARNGQFANSGLVVAVDPENWSEFKEHGPLAALEFQKSIEKKAFNATGSLVAPAQRVEDFIQGRISIDLPRTSYQPGVKSVDLHTILPKFIANSLREGLIEFGKKMQHYRSYDALLVGVETRTSSPVRIPRDKITFRHPEISNLIPCGEGAGYAGGIVSAAMDGMACAMHLLD
ncbi:MAG: FAD-binding protein [Chitinophagales bacterium]|nr:FAD-binding protein [Chitinophagales bacterium]